jgi:hypothetical protein
MQDRDPFAEEDLRIKTLLRFRTYDSLEEYGIKFLTGEACALGNRKLFDLTEEGTRRVEKFLGGAVGFREGSNTNSGAVASVLLPRSVIPDIALHIMWEEHEDVPWLIKTGTEIMGATAEVKALYGELARARYKGKEDKYRETLAQHEKMMLHVLDRIGDFSWQRGQKNARHPRRGDKNVHATSGTTHP